MMLRSLAGLVLVAAGLMTQGVGVSTQGPARTVPLFEVDRTWPKVPNNWVLGVISQVAIDRLDHAWIMRKSRGLGVAEDIGPAPLILEFDPAGNYIQGWGGPGDKYEWPDQEHGIFIDEEDNVWIGGSAGNASSVNKRSDDMLLKFTNKGKFLLQIGQRDQSRGNADTKNVRAPADAFVVRKTNEIFVADGYSNRRVIVLDAKTGAFKRMWGAFGNTPEDPPAPARTVSTAGTAAPATAGTPAPATAAQPAPRERETAGPGPPQFGNVHGIEVSNDGLVYVADRPNTRVQVFTMDGKYINQVFMNRSVRGSSVSGIAFSPDREQRFMYVAEMGGSKIVVLDRKKLEVLYEFGGRGANPGEFQGIHHLASDSKGNLYTSEVSPGNRAQRFIYKGLGARPPQ